MDNESEDDKNVVNYPKNNGQDNDNDLSSLVDWDEHFKKLGIIIIISDQLNCLFEFIRFITILIKMMKMVKNGQFCSFLTFLPLPPEIDKMGLSKRSIWWWYF